MENIETLTAKLSSRKEEITKIDQEIEQVKKELEDMKNKYPKVLTPASPEAKEMLKKSESSDWSKDEVEISTEDEKEFVLKNLSKLEHLKNDIAEAKIAAGELAFKLIDMTEQNSTTYERNKVTAAIIEKKDSVKKATEQMSNLDSTEVHFSYSGYRTDPIQNLNGALLHAIAFLKPKELYGQRIGFKELTETLGQKFKSDMDEGSEKMIRVTYEDLVKKWDDLERKKREL